MVKSKTSKISKSNVAASKNCCAYPCDSNGSWTMPAFTFGATLAGLYLVSTLIAFFAPSFYSYMGFALLRGSIPVSVGDFTGTHILAGLVAWFLVGMAVKCGLIYAKRAFKG